MSLVGIVVNTHDSFATLFMVSAELDVATKEGHLHTIKSSMLCEAGWYPLGIFLAFINMSRKA